MTLWWWILGACAIAYATKMAGYLLPDHWLDRPWVQTLSNGMTVGLLTALVVTNTLVTGVTLQLDARAVALLAAAFALWFRAPYLVVILVGGVAAALARMAGLWPPRVLAGHADQSSTVPRREPAWPGQASLSTPCCP